MDERRTAGAASVEHVGLVALIALATVAGIAALAASPPGRSARELGGTIARRLACVPRHPVPCGRNPLALAYDFPVGKTVRALAPRPSGALGQGGAELLPVDFRLCRRPSCAAPGPDPGLTASGRRVTLFTSVEDGRAAGGSIRITYWLYRPTLGWGHVTRTAGPADIAAASATRLDLDDDPALVALETLPGRNHYDFPASEEPPWRWLVPSRVP